MEPASGYLASGESASEELASEEPELDSEEAELELRHHQAMSSDADQYVALGLVWQVHQHLVAVLLLSWVAPCQDIAASLYVSTWKALSSRQTPVACEGFVVLP